MNEKLRAFLFPKLSAPYLIRLVATAVFAWLFFSLVLTPFFVRGKSMEPTFHDGAFNFILKQRYTFSPPERGDVVAIRLAGEKVFLLKRVIAVAGDSLVIKNGRLFINLKPVDEPYLNGPCDWNLPPRKVEVGNIYVIGDNRSMPMEYHDFGQVSLGRVVGAPLW